MLFRWPLLFGSLLYLLQVLLLVPMLLYHRTEADLVLACAVILQGLALLLCLLPSGLAAFRVLTRIAFTMALASGPFSWYSLHYMHGCVVTLEDYPWLLAFLIFVPPVFFRFSEAKLDSRILEGERLLQPG